MESIVYDLSYNDICNLPEEYRDGLFQVFDSYLKVIPAQIYRPNRKLSDMLELSLLQEEDLVSDYVFSGEKVNYYPNIKRVISHIDYTCPVSGVKCIKGVETIIFKPFFFLPDRKASYVLEKAIRAHYYYEDFFPRSIKEYDDFVYKVEHAYELGLEDYYNFSCNLGRGLNLKKLNRYA